MPKKKDIVTGGAPVSKVRENSRLMRTHESMVDFMHGRPSSGSFLDAFASGLFGLDFLRNLEDDLIYSDEDDDYDDSLYSRNAAYRPLEPHPRIRQLTDEEAEKHAKELIAEEERRRERTERNKRKKMRKKEKKRLEKENAVKDILPEEDKGQSDSSENQEENAVIECNAEGNDSPEPDKTTQNATEAAGCQQSSLNNKEEGDEKMNNKEDQDSDLNNSYVSTAKLEPEDKRPARETKKETTKLLQVQQLKEETANTEEKPDVQKKKEEKQESDKGVGTLAGQDLHFFQKSTDHAAEEFAKRSRELAGTGFRLAASGQYEMAVKYFTDAIKYNPKEFKLFGNRSLCYERMQQYENALRDADLALSMQPKWIKGLFRKGKALCGLKRYYEASLIYKEVLRLEGSSAEATQELKRAQTLHLMEMGFSWAQSSEALKTHATLEEAVEALFGGDAYPGAQEASASGENSEQPAEQEDEDDDEGAWIVHQTGRLRIHQVKESDELSWNRSPSRSPTPRSRSSLKPELFPVWVGSLAPAVTYSTLHELFSRAGMVYSIKMLLEHQCAFVNYTRKEDCDRAIQCLNGMVVEGAPLSVRYPNRIHTALGMSKSASTDPFTRPGPYKKECFFWRTSGCTRQDCTYRHVPEHKNIDKDKFTSRLGNFNM